MKIERIYMLKIVFQVKHVYFKYQDIPFGLSGIETYFQVYINYILDKRLNVYIIFYLNNRLIYK